MANIESPPVIVESIVIDAPIAAVFRALTDPDELVQWWGSDDGYRCVRMSCDLRPGGAWKTTGTRGDGKPFTVFGTYTAVEPPRLVEFRSGGSCQGLAGGTRVGTRLRWTPTARPITQTRAPLRRHGREGSGSPP